MPVYDLGRLPGGAIYYTMREVEGRRLDDLIASVHEARAAGTWHPDPEGWTLLRLVGVVRTVAEAVALGHDKGVLHRDLKPANVLVGRRGQVFVLDWGLAKVLGRADPTPTDLHPVVSDRSARGGYGTVVGQVVGTIGYMAPEQARGAVDELTPAADVFALDAILAEVATGTAPGDEPAVACLDAGTDAPEGRARIARRCLAADPANRPPDAGAVASALGAWLDGARTAERASLLAAAADAAWRALDAAERRVGSGLLSRVLDPSGRPRALGSVPDDPVAADVAQRLVLAGVLRRDPAGALHLADEGLVQAWSVLRGHAEDARRLAAVERVRAATEAWVGTGRDRGQLPSGALLAELEATLAAPGRWLAPDEVDLLEAARTEADAVARRRRRLQRGIVLASVAITLVVLASWIRAEQARERAEEAQRQTLAALDRATSAQLQALAAIDEAEGRPAMAIARWRAALALEPGADDAREALRELAATQVRVRVVPSHTTPVLSLQASPSGDRVATAGKDGQVWLRDTATGAALAGHRYDGWAKLDEFIDEDTLVAFSTDNEVVRLDARTGAVLPIQPPAGGSIIDIARGSGLVVSTTAEHVIATDLRTGAEVARAPTSKATAAGTLSEDGRFVLVPAGGSTDRSTDRFEVLDAATLRRVGGGRLPDGEHAYALAAGGRYGATIEVRSGARFGFDAETGEVWLLPSLAQAYANGFACAMDEGAPGVLCGTRDGHIRVVDLAARTARVLDPGLPGEVRRVKRSRDGGLLALAMASGLVRVVRADDGSPVEDVPGHDGDLRAVAWRDGRRVASADLTGELRLWDLQSALWRAGDPRPPEPIALAPDQRTLRVGDRSVVAPRGMLALAPVRDGAWAVDDARGVWRWTEADGWRGTAWSSAHMLFMASPDGSRLVLGREGGQSVEIVDPRDGRSVTRLADHALVPEAPAASLVTLDGRLLIGGDGRGRIRRWRMDDGAPLAPLIGPSEVEFSRVVSADDGGWVVGARRDGSVSAWRADRPDAPAWTRQLVGKQVSAELSGATLILSSPSDPVRVLDLATGQTRFRLTLPGGVGHLHAQDQLVVVPQRAGDPSGTWDLSAIPDDPLDTVARASNLRLCRDTLAVVPVVPYPAPDAPWAPDEACGD